MPGEAGEAGLAVDAGQDVQRELLWFLDNDMLARGIPPNHVVVLGTLEQAANGHVVSDYTRRAQREREKSTYA